VGLGVGRNRALFGFRFEWRGAGPVFVLGVSVHVLLVFGGACYCRLLLGFLHVKYAGADGNGGVVVFVFGVVVVAEAFGGLGGRLGGRDGFVLRDAVGRFTAEVEAGVCQLFPLLNLEYHVFY